MQHQANSVLPPQAPRIPFAIETILAFNVLLGIAVSLSVPVTVLTDSPVLAGFTDFVASLIPAIDRLAKVSQFPEVTRFTSAVLWATVPVQALLSVYPGIYVVRSELLRRRKVFYAISWTLLPLFVWMPANIVEPTFEQMTRKTAYHMTLRMVSESRLWLGMVGGLVSYTAGIFVFGFFTYWPRTWAIYFGRNNNQGR